MGVAYRVSFSGGLVHSVAEPHHWRVTRFALTRNTARPPRLLLPHAVVPVDYSMTAPVVVVSQGLAAVKYPRLSTQWARAQRCVGGKGQYLKFFKRATMSSLRGQGRSR